MALDPEELVTLTGHGERVVREMDESRGELADLLFAGLSDAQFTGFVAGMDAVLARLRAELAKIEAEAP